MPFKSKAQMRKCFAMKSRGEAKGWDCKEWADATKSPKSLPQHASKQGRGAGRPKKPKGFLYNPGRPPT
jgi:hypothetical protein